MTPDPHATPEARAHDLRRALREVATEMAAEDAAYRSEVRTIGLVAVVGVAVIVAVCALCQALGVRP